MDISLKGKWQHLRFVEIAGTGSYGTVYKAVSEQNPEEIYAVKVIDISGKEDRSIFLENQKDMDSIKHYYEALTIDFCEEIKTMDILKDCENIVAIIDSQIEKSEDGIGWKIYILMEYLQPFSELLYTKSIDEAEAIRMGIDICNALEFCEAHTILHRDIKPENILVSQKGVYKLADFGVAKNLEGTLRSGSLKGTYSYMAPEVYKGRKYGAQADIYSLGIILYKLFNHFRDPFLDPDKKLITFKDKEAALATRMEGTAFPTLSQVSPEFFRIITKACAYDTDQRYASAKAFKEDLIRLQNKGDKLSYDQDIISDNKDENIFSRYRKGIILGAAALILIAGGIFAVTRSKNTLTGDITASDNPSISEETVSVSEGVVIDPTVAEHPARYGKAYLLDLAKDADGFVIEDGTLIAYMGEEKEVIVPDGVSEIGYRAFYYSPQVEKIVLPESVNEYFFDSFTDAVNLKEFESKNPAIFLGREAFENVWDNEAVKFSPYLEKISEAQDGFAIINENMLAYYGDEKKIKIPDNVRKIGSMAFRFSDQLEEVTVPKDVVLWGTLVFPVGLKDIYFEDIDMDYALSRELFEEMTFEDSGDKVEILQDDNYLQRLAKENDGWGIIDGHLFAYYGEETEVTVPEDVYSIENDAFAGCNHLEKITVGHNVKNIADNAFRSCPLLEDVIYSD